MNKHMCVSVEKRKKQYSCLMLGDMFMPGCYFIFFHIKISYNSFLLLFMIRC